MNGTMEQGAEMTPQSALRDIQRFLTFLSEADTLSLRAKDRFRFDFEGEALAELQRAIGFVVGAFVVIARSQATPLNPPDEPTTLRDLLPAGEQGE